MGGSSQAQSRRHADQVRETQPPLSIFPYFLSCPSFDSSSLTLLFVSVTDQQLLWKHGSFWDRTNVASTAAAPDCCPSSYNKPPEETTQVDPQTCRSLVCCGSRFFIFHDINSWVSLFKHLKHWRVFGFCLLLVRREAGIFGEHKAEPSAASAAHFTCGTHQPGCYRNSLFEALWSAAGNSECRQLCGFLPGKDQCSWQRVWKDCLVFPQGMKFRKNSEVYRFQYTTLSFFSLFVWLFGVFRLILKVISAASTWNFWGTTKKSWP